MEMQGALKVETSTRGPVSYVRLSGIIDESFDPNVLLSAATTNKIILNLKQLTRLSSFGVREWTSTIRELGKRAEHIYFVECSPVVVNQLNMVDNFAGSARILSVQVPFACPSCAAEKELTCDLQQGPPKEVPKCVCDNCGTDMVFEDDFESYFSFPFSQQLGPMAPDRAIDGVLKQLSNPLARGNSGVTAVGETSRASSSPPTRTPIVRATLTPTAIRPPTVSDVKVITRTEPPSNVLRFVLLGLAAIIFGVGISYALIKLVGRPDHSELERRLADNRFREASRLLEKWEKNGELTAEQVDAERTKLVARAIRVHHDFLRAEKYEDAESVSAELERESSLPSFHRDRLNRVIAADRGQKFVDLRRQLFQRDQEQAFEQVAIIAERAERIAPLDRDMTIARAHALRLTGKLDDAMRAYDTFINMVDADRAEDPQIDSALFYRGKLLADSGRDEEAKKLLERCVKMECEHKETAAGLLQIIASRAPGSPSRAPR